MLRPAAHPPFGAFALPAWAERLRGLGAGLGPGALTRRMASLLRRIVLWGRADPIDVEPFPGQRARLHPRDNLSEKRVFGAAAAWERAERAALARAMAAAPAPFHFVDAGANAGLYALAVRSLGPARILAIEPEPVTRARLETNLALSEAWDVTVAPVALGPEEGSARIAAPGPNRGEARLGEQGVATPVRPLLALVEEVGWLRVDALKIDIEGAEAPVLAAFLGRAPRALWPALVILEAARGAETPALALLTGQGYVLGERTRLNAILSLPPRLRPPTSTPEQSQLDEANGKA